MTQEDSKTKPAPCGGTIRYSPDFWGDDSTEWSITFDFEELWQSHEEQLSAVVGRALLHEPPHMHVSEDGKQIEVFLYNVGGDCLTLVTPFENIFRDYVWVYGKTGAISEQQAIDLNCRKKALLEIARQANVYADIITKHLEEKT